MKATVDCVGGWSISVGFPNRPIFVRTCNQTVRVWALEKVWRGVRGWGVGGGGGGTQGKFGSGRITFIRPGLDRCVPPTLLTLPDTAPISRSPSLLHSRF